MKVIVKLFAGARELAGAEEVSVELTAGATVGQLREQLIANYAQLRPLVGHAMFAIGAVYCDDSVEVSEQAEIACIPPVSGG
ncbi:MAG: MoaD/ThiS family protein [Planctomycetales bacterium]|nr:MoaD/ThiS family protein [Planctomycetales bacterium]